MTPASASTELLETQILVCRTDAEIDACFERIEMLTLRPAERSDEDILAQMKATNPALENYSSRGDFEKEFFIGTPDVIVDRLKGYADLRASLGRDTRLRSQRPEPAGRVIHVNRSRASIPLSSVVAGPRGPAVPSGSIVMVDKVLTISALAVPSRTRLCSAEKLLRNKANDLPVSLQSRSGPAGGT